MAQPTQLLVTLSSAVVLVTIAVLAWFYRRRRASRSFAARLSRAAEGVLADVLVPDPEHGAIHVEFAVLGGDGIIIIDVRDVSGHVFGSESMQEWTVLDGKRRFTFANPLPALYDRTAAVKRLLPDVPVRGVVAFTGRALFSKGFPPNTVLVDGFLTELQEARNRQESDASGRSTLQSAWESLSNAAKANPR